MTPHSVAITGASGGIGAALAEAYAGPGVVLALAGRDGGRLERVAERCRALGAVVHVSQFDLTDPSHARAWVLSSYRRCPLDLLIANAGVSSSLGPKGEPEPGPVIDQVLAVNAGGAISVAAAAAECMLARGSGSIALVGSLAGLRGMADCPSYSASKAAVHAYGRALRDWLGPRGIGVTVICPGYVASPMSDRVEGPKPFMISSERAARIIQDGIRRNRALVAFPFALAMGIRLLSLLPEWLARLALRLFHFSVRTEGV